MKILKRAQKLSIKGGRRYFKLAWVLVLSALLVTMIIPQLLGRYSYFIDLFSHFQLQYIVAGVILLIFGVVLKIDIRYIGLFSLIFLIHFFLFIHQSSIFPTKATDLDGSISIFYQNIEFRNSDLDPIINQIQLSDPEIIVLVEANDLAINKVSQEFGDPISVQGNGALTCAIFSKNGGFEVEYKETNYGYVICGAIIDEINYLAIHPSPPMNEALFEEQKVYFENIRSNIDQLTNAGEDFILLGDFNSTNYSSTFRKYFGDLHKKNQYSWEVGKLQMLPIDHALSNMDIKVTQGVKTTSDHSPLYISTN